MDGKKNVKNRIESFFGGKGFYIVLFACLAVIGVSAWAMLLSGSPDNNTDTLDSLGEASVSVMAGQDDPVKDVTVKIPITGDGFKDAVKPDVSDEQDKPVIKEDTAAEPTVEDTAEQQEEVAEQKKLSFMWPVSGNIAVEYSPDTLIFNKTMADWRTHSGVDIAAQIGSKVFAAADGKVESVYADDLYGTTVVINHGSGITSVYSNLAATPTVKEGDAVTMGSVIGAVGDTALGETGEVAHLHFEMRAAMAPADPADYLPRR